MEIKQENYSTININQINKSNFSKICRICLTMEANLLFENAAEHFTKLNISFGFELTQDDILPKAFCTGCLTKINIIYEFKKLCTYSEQILKNVLIAETLKVKEECLYSDQILKCEDSNRLLGIGDPLTVKIEQDIKTEFPDSIEPSNYESAINYIEDIKADMNLLTEENVHLNEYRSDDDITDHTSGAKIDTVKEKNTDKSISANITSLFNQHVLKFEGDSGFECQLCKKQINKRLNMRKHLMSHIPREQRIQRCAICDRPYIHKDSYLRHLREHRKGKPKKEILLNKTSTTIDNYICEYCGKIFGSKTKVRCHRVIHTGEKPYLCKVCGKRFPQRGGLWCHKQKHKVKK